ncbi:MAG: LuxR C-terminal-related transcriptional regulator [Gemmatimonadales bacterium]
MDAEELEGRSLDLTIVLILVAVAVGGMADLLLDAPGPGLSPHLVFELVLIVVSLGAAIYLARGWLGARRVLAATRKDLATRERERDHWRASAERSLASLGEEVGRQFDRWGLTRTERETALSLLRGQSVRRIATDTGRSERTIRQHAVAVYRKSGLSNRAEFAGFFLGSLLVPDSSDEGAA